MADLTLTARELVEAAPGLARIGLRDFKDNEIAAYVLAKIKRKANPELADLEASRVRLNEKHAQKDADNQPVKHEDRYVLANPAAFAVEWDALLAEPITLAGCRALTIAELKGTGVSPDELMALGPIVAES